MFNIANWLQWEWVGMILRQCAGKVHKARKKGRRANNCPATDLAEHMGQQVTDNMRNVPNMTWMVVICRVLHSNKDMTSSMQLQPSYTMVSHRVQLTDFIEKNCIPKVSCCLTVIYKCNTTQKALAKEYMGLYILGQMMNYPLYGQIS
jgi:hypothetical protein